MKSISLLLTILFILIFPLTQALAADFVTCESRDDKRSYCSIPDVRDAQINLYNQMSKSDCVEGRSWGRDSRGIWVDRGCRAEFEIIRDRDDRYGSHSNREWNRWNTMENEKRELSSERERLEMERARLEQEKRELASNTEPKAETCPSGFHPGRCSDKQRKHGCKDVGLPGGLVCRNK